MLWFTTLFLNPAEFERLVSLLSFYHFAEAYIVAIKILSSEFTTSVRLVAQSVINLGSSADKFGMECVHVGNPEVDVPELIGYGPMWNDVFRIISLSKHDEHSITF